MKKNKETLAVTISIIALIISIVGILVDVIHFNEENNYSGYISEAKYKGKHILGETTNNDKPGNSETFLTYEIEFVNNGEKTMYIDKYEFYDKTNNKILESKDALNIEIKPYQKIYRTYKLNNYNLNSEIHFSYYDTLGNVYNNPNKFEVIKLGYEDVKHIEINKSKENE